MRFLHISDLHFGAKDETENQFIIDNFVKIQEYATKNKIDNIIISGDIFDTPDINTKYRELFSNNKLNYFVIPGNHDNNDNLRSFFIEMNNVTYFANNPYSKKLVGNIMIYGAPYNNSIKPMELFAEISKDINSNKSDRNILIVHGSPVGVDFGMIDADRGKINYFPIHFDDLLPLIYIKKDIYMAMGHFHKIFRNWEFDQLKVCMPGSIYPLSSKEVEKRSFSIYDSENHSFTRVALDDLTNLIFKYIFISPFDVNNALNNISNSIMKTTPINKAVISMDGYINDLRKIDEIKEKINTLWSKKHKIPIEWNINVTTIKSLKPEIKNILSKIDEEGEKNSVPEEIISKAKKLVFEAYKGTK